MCIVDLYVKHLNNMVEHYWQIYHFDMEPNHTSHNNEADAFKHTYMQAELTLWLGRFIAKIIGNIHENKPDNPPKEKEMDLYNNSVGRQIGADIRKSYPLWIFTKWQDKIATRIMLAMKAGLLITNIKEKQ